MTQTLSVKTLPGVDVVLRRSSQARRLSLRVSRLDGRVTLTSPPRVPMGEVVRFLEEKGDWVRGHLNDQPVPVAVAPGIVLPVLGEPVTLRATEVKRALRDENTLGVHPLKAGAQAKAYVQTVARDRLAAQCDRAAATLGRSFSALVFRDTRSRWGSCSSAGRLMFSWRLALAPARILDYVAAHEVAHLVEMNHSRAFWDIVARLHPGFVEDRAWLRSNGAWLHRYRFDSSAAHDTD